MNWALEIPAPNVVNRNGFDRSICKTMVESGEEVTVTAYAAKDGSKHACRRTHARRRADGDHTQRDSESRSCGTRRTAPAITAWAAVAICSSRTSMDAEARMS